MAIRRGSTGTLGGTTLCVVRNSTGHRPSCRADLNNQRCGVTAMTHTSEHKVLIASRSRSGSKRLPLLFRSVELRARNAGGRQLAID